MIFKSGKSLVNVTSVLNGVPPFKSVKQIGDPSNSAISFFNWALKSAKSCPILKSTAAHFSCLPQIISAESRIAVADFPCMHINTDVIS